MRISDWSSDVCSSDLTVHVAFRPIFRPNRLAESPQAKQDVAATGLIALRNVLALLDERLGEGPYTLGNQLSLCDLYLFVFVLWSRRPVLAASSEEHTSELQSLMRT